MEEKAIKIEKHIGSRKNGMCDGIIENFHVHARHDIVNLFSSLLDTIQVSKTNHILTPLFGEQIDH